MLSKPSPQYYPTYHVLHCRSSQLSCMSMSSLYWGVQNWMLHPDVVLWDSSNSCFTASWGQPRSQSASWAAGFPAETLSLLPTRIPSAFASELFSLVYQHQPALPVSSQTWTGPHQLISLHCWQHYYSLWLNFPLNLLSTYSACM